MHSIDPVEENFCEDVDSCDVDRYGMTYARYKARILKKSKPKVANDDDDDDEDEEDKSEKSDYGDTSTDSCDYDDYYDSVTGDYD